MPNLTINASTQHEHLIQNAQREVNTVAQQCNFENKQTHLSHIEAQYSVITNLTITEHF